MTEDFTCPACGSRYIRIRVRFGPRTAERHRVTCIVCESELDAGAGEHVFKYFLMQRGARSDKPQ